MKNTLLSLLGLFLALLSTSILAQQNHQIATAPIVKVPTADLQAICNAADNVLKNNQYLTADQKKILKKAKTANAWTLKELADFELEIKALNNNNNPTGPTGATCTDALLNCEDNCAKNGASYYGSNCLALCQIDYTDCLAKLTKHNQPAQQIPTNLPIKKK